VLVGINLLREGLDIPEVSLVAILDADKEGFLRSNRSLIQTFGRAARNSEGRVFLYADKVTGSMASAMEETTRRREKQMAYNAEHGITPQTIRKSVDNLLGDLGGGEAKGSSVGMAAESAAAYGSDPKQLKKMINKLERDMREAAKELEFERAAELRDRVAVLRERILELG